MQFRSPTSNSLLDGQDLLNCAKRELHLRETMYPVWIQEGSMTQDKATKELELQAGIVQWMERNIRLLHGEHTMTFEKVLAVGREIRHAVETGTEHKRLELICEVLEKHLCPAVEQLPLFMEPAARALPAPAGLVGLEKIREPEPVAATTVEIPDFDDLPEL